MADLPQATLRRLVSALDSLKLPFAIIGGIAVSIRSVPRFTTDVDAVLWVGEDGWPLILKGLGDFGFQPRAVDPIALAKKNRLLLLVDPDGVEVDLSFGALPIEQEIVASAERIEVAPGLSAPIVTAGNLVVMKAIAWRPKDKLDIREIVSINQGIDWARVVSTFSEFAELLEVPERVSDLQTIIDESLN